MVRANYDFNSLAFYDCLSVAQKIQIQYENIVELELHLFTYLACLLSLYKGNPVASWGYKFVGIPDNVPFSQSIEESVLRMKQIGLLIDDKQYLEVSKRGNDEYERLSTIAQFHKREPFLAGACASMLSIPMNVIRSALSEEPTIKNVKSTGSPRILLNERNPYLTLLYDQFQNISKAIGVELDSLMVPAVLWITYLSQLAESSSG